MRFTKTQTRLRAHIVRAQSGLSLRCAPEELLEHCLSTERTAKLYWKDLILLFAHMPKGIFSHDAAKMWY